MNLVGGSQRKPVVATLLVGLLGAAISLGRLWWANSDALTQVLWAEDGLFPLCVEKAGYLSCLFDPFAGYSIFLPRVLAGITSVFPPSEWALVANLIAAVLAGIACGWVWWWLTRYGLHWFTTLVTSLLLVIAPIVGLEALNVVASVYMPLLFLSVIVLAFPLRPYPVKTVSVLLLVTALTIPSAALLLLVLLAQLILRHLSKRIALWLGGSLMVGLVVQGLVSLMSDVPRPINPDWEAFRAWVELMPTALLSFIPGLGVGEVTVFTNYVSTPSVLLGWVVVLGLLGWSIIMLKSKNSRLVGSGLLVVFGLAVGAFPSVIGYSNNRYFVVPCVLFAAALLVSFDGKIQKTNLPVLMIISLVTLAIWWPALPASKWRSTPAPAWQGEMARLAAHCIAAPGLTERPVFTPFWPPNWGDGLVEPSHPNLSCSVGMHWR